MFFYFFFVVGSEGKREKRIRDANFLWIKEPHEEEGNGEGKGETNKKEKEKNHTQQKGKERGSVHDEPYKNPLNPQ